MRNKLHYIVTFSLITFLGYTFVNKLINFDAFLINIAKTGAFNGNIIYAVAFYALITEMLSILLLVINEKVGHIVTLAVILSYTLYIIFLVSIGKYEVCGCGGILNRLPFMWHFIINIIIVSSLLFVCTNEKKY